METNEGYEQQTGGEHSRRWRAPMMMMTMFKTIMLYNENDKWWKRAKNTESNVCMCVFGLEHLFVLSVDCECDGRLYLVLQSQQMHET